MADLRSALIVDCDTGGGTELVNAVNLRLSSSGGSIEAIGSQVSALSIPVVIASDQAAIAVNSELPTAAALTDNFVTPTAPGVGAFGMVYDGSAWDMLRGTSADGVLVNLGANNDITLAGTVTVDSELAAASALTDNFATPTTAPVGAFTMVYDGAAWDFCRGTAADGMLVNLGSNNDVTITSGAITADTELPTAAALTGDAVSSPTAPAVAGFGFGYNGTNWDRIRTANTGRLQVDVITGGGAPGAPTTPLADYVTSAAVEAGAEVQLDSAEAAGKSLAQVTVWSSVAYRARVFLVNNSVEATEALAVGGGPPHVAWTWIPPHAAYATLGTTAGADTFRVEFFNLDDAAAADAHCVFLHQA